MFDPMMESDYQRWKKGLRDCLLLMMFALLASIILTLIFFNGAPPLKYIDDDWFKHFTVAQSLLVTLPIIIGILLFTREPKHMMNSHLHQALTQRVLARFALPALLASASIVSLIVIYPLTRENRMISTDMITVIEVLCLLVLPLWACLASYGGVLASCCESFSQLIFRISSLLFWGATGFRILGYLGFASIKQTANVPLGDIAAVLPYVSLGLAGAGLLTFIAGTWGLRTSIVRADEYRY